MYRNKEGLTGVLSNIDITTVPAFAALFSGIGISQVTTIRTDKDITVRLNAADEDAITIPANEKFECDWEQVSKIFITAPVTANVKISTSRGGKRG